jgi:hypothetical protein
MGRALELERGKQREQERVLRSVPGSEWGKRKAVPAEWD